MKVRLRSRADVTKSSEEIITIKSNERVYDVLMNTINSSLTISLYLTMKNIFYIEPYIVFYALFYTLSDSAYSVSPSLALRKFDLSNCLHSQSVNILCV